MPPTSSSTPFKHVGPSRSWVNVPNAIYSTISPTSRLSPLPSSIRKGLTSATKKRVCFFASPSTSSPSKDTRPGAGSPSNTNTALPRLVFPGQSSPRKSSHLFAGTTAFIPNTGLDLSLISPSRKSAFFTAFKVAQDLIDNPPPPSASLTHVLCSPQVSPPHLSSPQVPYPQVSSPQVPSPQVSSPQVPSPKVSSPQVPSPKVSSPQVPSLVAAPTVRPSDVLAAFKAVQDLIDNPSSTSSASAPSLAPAPTVITAKVISPSPSPSFAEVCAKARASPIVPRPITRQVRIKVVKPVILATTPGVTWEAARHNKSVYDISPATRAQKNLRIQKWTSGMPSPVLPTSPVPTALRDIPISPLSSSMFDSSIGAPSPEPCPPVTPQGLRTIAAPSSCHSDFYGLCSASSSQPSTPTRPEGYLDWWYSEMSPVLLDSTPVKTTPRFMENLSPLGSSLFDSPERILEASPRHPTPSPSPVPRSPCTHTPSPVTHSIRRPISSPSPVSSSPCAYTPSPVVQQRRCHSQLTTPDFSPIRVATHFAISSSPSERSLSFADLNTRFAAMPSAPSHSLVCQTPPQQSPPFSWKAVAGYASIAAGAFALGCLATRYLF